ncbi:hypothetical protein HMPREF9711_00748 [Myroides odoratimimus CCUG 3837]|nr:hypothetical protein HMPREF9711_00748 [Myroides odoratimimus CCUG 3837]
MSNYRCIQINIKVTVNVAELRQIEKEQRQRLQNDSVKF